MKVKLDENIPSRLKNVLEKRGHDVHTVADEGMVGFEDNDVWKQVCSEERFLITQDLDFSDVRIFEPGTHSGILLIRLKEPGANAIVEKVSLILNTESLEDWARCFVVLTENKLRIRSPKEGK